MLWLAEKCTELGATSWRPIEWRRSASVSPRGSGPAFQARLEGRMISALTQSGGAWLPEVCDAAPLAEAIRSDIRRHARRARPGRASRCSHLGSSGLRVSRCRSPWDRRAGSRRPSMRSSPTPDSCAPPSAILFCDSRRQAWRRSRSCVPRWRRIVARSLPVSFLRSVAMASDPGCLFCRIVRGEIPAQIEYETPTSSRSVTSMRKRPCTCSSCRATTSSSLNDVGDPGLVGELAAAATAIARRDGFADSGYRTVVNTNEDGGQTVGHLHMHLLAGQADGLAAGVGEREPGSGLRVTATRRRANRTTATSQSVGPGRPSRSGQKKKPSPCTCDCP